MIASVRVEPVAEGAGENVLEVLDITGLIDDLRIG